MQVWNPVHVRINIIQLFECVHLNAPCLFCLLVLQQTVHGAQGGIQSLSSSGSCLESLRTNPVVECDVHGTCMHHEKTLNFWLRSVDENQQFATPVAVKLQNEAIFENVSRCRVCRKLPTPWEVWVDGAKCPPSYSFSLSIWFSMAVYKLYMASMTKYWSDPNWR